MTRDLLFWIILCYCLIMLIGAARGNDYPTHDAWGHKFPEACRQDLRWMKVPIVRLNLPAAGILTGPGRQVGYWYHSFKTKVSTIYIDTSVITEWEYDAVLQHELCHERMFRLTGSPKWHKGDVE